MLFKKNDRIIRRSIVSYDHFMTRIGGRKHRWEKLLKEFFSVPVKYYYRYFRQRHQAENINLPKNTVSRLILIKFGECFSKF
jgi:transposase